MKETIIGDILAFEEHPEYKNEWVATWRGYTVATATVQENGWVELTEWHPDGESTSYTSASSLSAAWRHIKNYTLTDFDDELRNYLAPSKGFRTNKAMKIVRKEIVEGLELNLRTHPDGYKWIATRKSHAVAMITKMQLAHEIYHLDFYYSKEGYTLIENFDSLDDAWEKTKEYIAYFNL